MMFSIKKINLIDKLCIEVYNDIVYYYVKICLEKIMKRLLSVFLIAIFFAFSGTTVFASENAEIFFNTYSSEKEENVCVDVNISKGGSPVMLQYCINYDSDALDCVSVTVGDAFKGNSAPIINKTEGKIYFIWDSFNPIEDGGTMLKMEFKPKQEVKTSVGIDMTESFVVADASFNDIGKVNGKAEIDFAPEKEEQTSSSSTASSNESFSMSTSSDPESSSSSTSSKQESSSSKSEPQQNGSNNGITLDKNAVTVNPGTEVKVEITEGEKEDVFWYSSNDDVVVVEDGKIVPVAPGTATVTVSTKDGTEEATVVITVTEDDIPSEEETVENIEVDPLNREPEEKTSPVVYVVIVVLVAAIGTIGWLISKKLKK